MRHRRLAKRLADARLDGYLVSRPANLEYLFGFRGSAGLALCRRGPATLLVDSRYLTLARATARHCRTVLAPDSLEKSLKKVLRRACRRTAEPLRIGFESDFVSRDYAAHLNSWKLPIEWIPCPGWIAQQRIIKEADEVEALRQAFRQAQAAFAEAMAETAPGQSEVEIAGRLEWALRRHGAEG